MELPSAVCSHCCCHSAAVVVKYNEFVQIYTEPHFFSCLFYPRYSMEFSESMPQVLSSFWNLPAEQILHQLKSRLQGLSSQEAQQRLIQYGSNNLKQKRQSNTLLLLLNQFKSPIILILIAAAILSSFLRDTIDAVIILAIILISGLLGFWQERGASDAVAKLLALVQVKATVVRNGQSQDIPSEDVVPGDIVLLAAGDNIPGDCLLLESKDLSMNEAALTGETYPADKLTGVLPAEVGLSQRTNTLY
ncbi:MAG: hypothetical protein RLZZ574_2686, partial [Cyanobacteriota bacterium]